MAEKQFCTFFLNGIYFGIDVQQVQEVMRYQEMTPVPLAPSDICGLINLRGKIVTAIDLKQRLSIKNESVQSKPKLDEEQLGFNVIVRTDSELVSLLVDEVGDVLPMSEDYFEPPPATLQGRLRQVLQGAYKLEDRFLLVLDIDKLLEMKGHNLYLAPESPRLKPGTTQPNSAFAD